MKLRYVLLILASVPCFVRSQESPLTFDIIAVYKQGRGTPEGRAAWDRLCQGDPQELLPILRAMRGLDTSACNWLRTAFDAIVERTIARKQNLPVARLLEFAQDPREAGRARRLALDLVEKINPGTSEKQFPLWLADPEFRYEAVAVTLERGRRLLKSGAKEDAQSALQTALAAARDVQQTRDVAASLETFGIKISVGEHLGFLMDWHLIGPF